MRLGLRNTVVLEVELSMGNRKSSESEDRIEIDDASLVEIERDRKKRELMDTIERSRLATGREHERALMRQRAVAPLHVTPVSQKSHWFLPLAFFVVSCMFLSGVWLLLTHGRRSYFELVSFLGFAIRPHVITSLLMALLINAYLFSRLSERLRKGNKLVEVGRLTVPLELLQIKEAAAIGLALRLISSIISSLSVSLIFSCLGWEYALTYLGGVKATIILFMVSGVAISELYRRFSSPSL